MNSEDKGLTLTMPEKVTRIGSRGDYLQSQP